MWKLTSKSIKEVFKSKGEGVITKPRKAPLDSSGDVRKTTKKERLECPICWESFNFVENVPYVLWCGHTICKYCLIGLQRAVVIKSSALPFQLPFFVACPWCSSFSLRLVCNGIIRFPSKNYYLLWMVDCRSESRSDNKRLESDMKKRCEGVSKTSSDDVRLLETRGWWNGVTRGYFRTGRLHDFVCKSMALVGKVLVKFPLVVIFLLVSLYAIPVSAAVLGVYVFVTFALAVPSLNWLIREISA